MKYVLGLVLLLVTSSAFAAEGNLDCRFGSLVIRGYLKDNMIEATKVDDAAGEDLNQNPVTATDVGNSLSFEFSTVNSAGDSGTLTTLYIPKEIRLGVYLAAVTVVDNDMSGALPPLNMRGKCKLTK